MCWSFCNTTFPRAGPAAGSRLAPRVETASGAWTFSAGAFWNETGSDPRTTTDWRSWNGTESIWNWGGASHKVFMWIRHRCCFHLLKRVTSQNPDYLISRGSYQDDFPCEGLFGSPETFSVVTPGGMTLALRLGMQINILQCTEHIPINRII